MADSRAETVLGHLRQCLGSATTPAADAALWERFVRHRDDDAFSELVARHGPLVFGVCRRLLGNVQDAEDVFQATFLVLARKAATIRKPQSLSCFLHGIAYRLALKARSETERRRSLERQTAPFSACAEVDLSWREVRGLLDEELQRLPEKQRLPLVLCYLEGLTQDEASRRLDWPRGTLKRRLEAGRERLRIRLTRRGVTLGAGLFVAALTDSSSRAIVPVALRSATVRAAFQFLTHDTAAVVATPAALLAMGALQSMLTTKLKLGVLLVLLFGFALTAAGWSLPHAPPGKQPEIKDDTPTPVQSAKNSKARTDLYGDPLPPGAKARLGTLRLRHPSMTTSAVFTRDGKTAIVGDVGGSIVFWDVASGREVRRLHNLGGSSYALAITGDGKTLASAAWGTVSLWEVATGKLRSRTELKNDAISQMLFTPDGKTLALRYQGDAIDLWDIAGDKKPRELKGHTGTVASMTLSPDSKTLASGAWKDKDIRLWDVASGKEKRKIATVGTDIYWVAFSPDGKTLAARGNSLGFSFFDTNTGKMIRRVKGNYGGVGDLVYAPDGKTFVGREGNNRNIHILDAASGKQIRKLEGPPGMAGGLAISPDGKTIATFWGGAPTFDLWDTSSGKLLHTRAAHRGGVTGLAFTADGATLFSSAYRNDYGMFVWDAATGEPRDRIDGNLWIGYHSLVLSPDGKLLAVSGAGSIRLLDPASRKVVRTCIGPNKVENVTAVVWSADGKTLASLSPGNINGKTIIQVWDPATGKQRCLIEARQAGRQIALTADGAMVAASGNWNGAVRLWATASGKELRPITIPHGFNCPVAFSPSGQILACGGREISLWDPATGRLLRRWDKEASELVFSSDGRTLVSAGFGDETIRLWETETGKERASFAGQRGGISVLAISRNGRSVASGSGDTTILVWDATGGARSDAVLSAEQLRTLWRDLKATDAGRAYRALWQLALSPKQALPFLTEHLHPATPLDAAQQKQVERLLADLDSDRFAVRQEAEAELEKLGLVIEPALAKALEGKPPLEARKRIETVRAKFTDERLRLSRALEAIEHMNTPEARAIGKRLCDSPVKAQE